MARLKDCNILQPRHLVKNRLGGMHDSINVQNFRSDGFACTSSQTMSCTIKEHLAWCDLRKKTEYPEELDTHTTQADQDL
jgi:hypothetical protein